MAFLQDDDQQTGDFGSPIQMVEIHTGATAAAVAATAPLGGAVDDEVLRGPCPAMSLWDFLNKTDIWRLASRNLVLACICSQAFVYLYNNRCIYIYMIIMTTSVIMKVYAATPLGLEVIMRNGVASVFV